MTSSQPVHLRPWQSIQAGVVAPSSRPLGFDEAIESPCATCSTSPCCTHLPIHSFTVGTVADLSYVDYLLNFERIRVGLASTGEWQAYYVQPCRYLDRDTFECTVHDTPEQPQICRQYNPYQCWYRRTLTVSVSEEFLMFDRARFAVFKELVAFDDQRRLVATPGWDDLMAALHDVGDPHIDEPGPEPPLPDAPFERWVKVTIGAKPSFETRSAATTVSSYDDGQSPCKGCAAPCCETLSFPQGLPSTRTSIDFLRFALGFPGVELTVNDAGWWLTVKTTCRHLVDGDCAIYGQPERPLTCRYYDEWQCSYRHEFGDPVPDDILRVRLEQFAPLVEQLGFDERGQVAQLPLTAQLRAGVERAMHTDAHA